MDFIAVKKITLGLSDLFKICYVNTVLHSRHSEFNIKAGIFPNAVKVHTSTKVYYLQQTIAVIYYAENVFLLQQLSILLLTETFFVKYILYRKFLLRCEAFHDLR